jgi:hypothetical protein
LKNKPEELWVTNINRFQDITIGDLAITVRRGQSLNLLARKKNGLSMYNITRKQIDDSIQKGSIYQKGIHIKVRSVEPQIFTKKIEVAKILDMGSTRTIRKPPEIEQIDFPDLDMDEGSAEDFAAENADMDAADRAPILAVDPIFKKTINDE